ncbi:hypothetical protein ACSVBT_14230 [Afipia sp. TerB]
MESGRSLVDPLSDFDDFLFAVICEERDGAELSVLSALARSDVDPWEEAARISKLDVPAAEEALAAIVERAMVHGTSGQKAMTIDRLLRLLPGQRATGKSASDAMLSRTAKTPDLGMQMLIFLVGWWSFVMVVAAFAPQKTTTGADAPPAYMNSILPPQDYRPENSPVIRDGFPYAINRSQH